MKLIVLSVANDADHSRMRKLMSHAFSDSSLREQEPLIRSYCDLLIKRLYDQIEGPKKGDIDIASWFNFTTFDIIGDLSFAEPFHGLEQGKYHFWIESIFRSLKMVSVMRLVRAYPPLATLFFFMLSLFPSVTKAKLDHQEFCRDKVMRRLERKTDRRDFMTQVFTLSYSETTA
jgi:cytochrome P450